MELSFMPLLPASLLVDVVVTLWVSFMDQIELYNHLLYLKPFKGLQTKGCYQIELLKLAILENI